MFVDGRRIGRDDLLFYVMYDHNADRDTVEVMRKDTKNLPRSVTASGPHTTPWLAYVHTCTSSKDCIRHC